MGNDPHAALASISRGNENKMISLPNGKSMTIKDAISLAEGKTAIEFLQELSK